MEKLYTVSKNKENSPPLTRSTTCTLHEAYTNHWTNLMRAETKRKKDFNLKAWEKETSNTISFKNNNNEQAEKYRTNEGKN